MCRKFIRLTLVGQWRKQYEAEAGDQLRCSHNNRLSWIHGELWSQEGLAEFFETVEEDLGLLPLHYPDIGYTLPGEEGRNLGEVTLFSRWQFWRMTQLRPILCQHFQKLEERMPRAWRWDIMLTNHSIHYGKIWIQLHTHWPGIFR